jgi:hypothetical protein
MAQRNQRNKTSEQIKSSKEAVKQAAKEYKEQKNEQQKQADELRNKSLLNKYTRKAQANYKAKKAQKTQSKPSYAQAVSSPPPVPPTARRRSQSFDESPNTFFKRLQDASPSTLNQVLSKKSKQLDAVQTADQAIDKGKTKRTTSNLISSSGVDTSQLPLTTTQRSQQITSYETNIAEITKILADIGSGSITKDQKAIINKYLPEFVGSTNAKAKRVQEALSEMEKKLSDAKLEQGMSKVRSKAPMTANPVFDLPKPPAPVAGGGGTRK